MCNDILSVKRRKYEENKKNPSNNISNYFSRAEFHRWNFFPPKQLQPHTPFPYQAAPNLSRNETGPYNTALRAVKASSLDIS